jgi:hypothetical protein
MPRFISNSGSFQDLIVTGSRLYVASSSIFFNNLATSSTAPNVLLLDSTGQVYYTASNALSAAPQTFNTSSLLTTASAVTNQNQIQFTKGDGSTFNVTIVSASYALSSSYATTASYALNGGSGGTTYFIATGSVTASVNVGTGNVFTLTSGSTPTTLIAVSASGNVGIGTSTPTAKLEVSASTSNTFVISGVGASATNLISVTGSGGQILKLDTNATATTMSLKMNGIGATSTWDFITAGGTNVNGGSNNNYILSNQYADLNLKQYSALVVQQTGPSVDNPIIFQVKDSSSKKYLQIDTGSTTISGSFNANNTLFVSGSNVTISGSFAVVSGSTEFQVLSTGIKMGNSSSDAHIMTGSFRISGTGNTGSILTVIGSGSLNPIFTVQGSQGELFSVTDSLTGSLFSVNDISGLPILDVNSDQTTKIGSYLAPGLYASARVTANTGITVIYSIPTASYDSAYFDYNIRSGSVGRAGSIIAMWSGSSVNYSEASASSFGTTNTFVLGVSISGSNMILSGSAPSDGWTVKTIVKAI